MSKVNFKKAHLILISILLLVLVLGLSGWVIFRKVLDKVSFEKQNSLNYKDAATEVSLNKENSLPNGFPTDFPIYPGAKITTSWKTEEEGAQGYSLVLETSDSLEKVTSFYNSELTKTAWNIENTIKEVNSGAISFNKDGSKGFIGLVENESKVIISLSLGIAK